MTKARRVAVSPVDLSRYTTEIVKTVALAQPFDNCVTLIREGTDIGYEPVGLALVKYTNGAHHLEIVVLSSSPKDGNPDDWQMIGPPMLLTEFMDKVRHGD